MESTVVSFAEGSTAVMGKLACILSQEYRLLTGVGAEIQYIKDELGSMNAFLQDLLMSSDHTRQVKDWMKQVREIAYDVEDCIDEFRHGIDDSDDYNDGPLCFLDSIICVCFRDLVMPFNSSARHCIAMDVKELKNRIQQVSDRRQRYGVAVIPRTSTSRATSTQIGGYSRLSSFFLQEDYLIDIKKRRDTIVEWLMEENQPDHGVISIFGYGGIGKSTLATMAYTSPRVTSGYFQHRAMVTVSQKVNIESVFRDILRQVNTDKDLSQEVESWDMFQLAEELQTYLKQTRVFFPGAGELIGDETSQV
ncbi:hypothetical protein LUZ60_002380 [Juncus effusus]|nr:hypothetical protein LUZ60_002380 [Juncus effusus]